MTEWQCIPHGWHVHVSIDCFSVASGFISNGLHRSCFTVASGFISNGLHRSVRCPWPQHVLVG